MSNILVIDNDRNYWEFFECAFSNEHFVEFISAFEELGERATKNRPDIIFVDLETTGLTVSETVSHCQDICAADIYLMAEFSEENLDEMERAWEQGFIFKVYRKPLNITQIKQDIS